MPGCHEIVEYADELLESSTYADYGPNGLQVAGDADVTHIATAVSCTLEVFQAAADAGAEMLVVHHGLFWRGDSPVIDELRRDRLSMLFEHGINLVAYHLPLDGHHTLGNNAQLRDALGLLPEDRSFAIAGGQPIGRVGRYEEGVPLDEFAARVESVVERPPLMLGDRPDRVHRVAICSGGAARQLREARALGVDAMITGEPAEDTHAEARESGIAFLAAGHYATETFGVRALGAHLAERFGVRHTFIPVENPV